MARPTHPPPPPPLSPLSLSGRVSPSVAHCSGYSLLQALRLVRASDWNGTPLSPPSSLPGHVSPSAAPCSWYSLSEKYSSGVLMWRCSRSQAFIAGPASSACAQSGLQALAPPPLCLCVSGSVAIVLSEAGTGTPSFCLGLFRTHGPVIPWIMGTPLTLAARHSRHLSGFRVTGKSVYRRSKAESTHVCMIRVMPRGFKGSKVLLLSRLALSVLGLLVTTRGAQCRH